MHDVILGYKAALDQLQNRFTYISVKSLLRLPGASTHPVRNVVEMLLSFIENAKKEVLCKFLCFVTSCKSSTAALKPGCVHVSIDVPYTCVLELKVLLHFISSEQFDNLY